MKLEQYLNENNIRKTDFAKAIGCPRGLLYKWLNDSEPGLAYALKIVKVTGGKVKLKDLANDKTQS
jgi:predicted transcriptional regulator